MSDLLRTIPPTHIEDDPTPRHVLRTIPPDTYGGRFPLQGGAADCLCVDYIFLIQCDSLASIN